ncbi:UNVERIFIED_CONTAM: CubicO group peptidase (beta-lactamase class C family) [Streptomyces graminofaciens]
MTAQDIAGAPPPAAVSADLDMRLEEAVRAVDAPDVVFACSVDGRRTVRCGGTGPAPPVPRELLRYEIGSASKTFTGLLLARLVLAGLVSGDDAAAVRLAGTRPAGTGDVTLMHLVTHTSGLPSLPSGFRRQALPRWSTNPYAGYPAERVVRTFLDSRPRHRPGTRWRYSNFGVAVLGHTLAAATATPWDELLTRRVLEPLGLAGTGLSPAGPAVDATGHRADGATPTPPFLIGGFQAAGAVRARPHDLLTFLEAHLAPDGRPLADALRWVCRPVLRRGWGHRHEHTPAWFRHPTANGPMYFHSGATSGQQAFLGFCPDTGIALAALSTRRYHRRDGLVSTAYRLLSQAG